MKYVTGNLENRINKPTAVTLGKFDGIHKGHRKLIELVKKEARERNLESVVLTFDVLPGMFFYPGKYTFITTNYERKMILEEEEIDCLVELPFNEATASMEPEQFIEQILVGMLHAKVIIVGEDNHFGKDRRGDAAMLQKMAAIYGYEVQVIKKEEYNGIPISSSEVREQLKKGNMENVNLLLGYPYKICDTVMHGRELGRTMGFPTINMIPSSKKLLPPNGVYASKIKIDGKNKYGISNIGVKPTVQDEMKKDVETFIFDYDGDLYGDMIEVELYHFQRPEMKFDSLEMLSSQIEKDIAFTKEYFML